MDAKQYGWNVKNGKVHGKERELQRAVVFEQYAEALNEVECWIGKLAFLIVIGQIQWMEGWRAKDGQRWWWLKNVIK